MDKLTSRFKKTQVKYSITDDTLQIDGYVKDSFKPYTLIEWLDNTDILLGNTDQYIDDYNVYLRAWSQVKGTTVIDTAKTISETYISLLKEIALNYATLEEKRYFNTLDYNNPLDLDAALPFFARRIKEIILYFAKKRELIKHQKTKFSLQGGTRGVARLIYDNIISILAGDSITTTKDQTLPALSAVTANFRISVEELYDLSEDYYDVDGATPSTIQSDGTLRITGGTTYG